MTYPLRTLALLITGSLLLLVAPLQTARAQPTGTYDALDVVFVVDQSGSMFGTAGNPATDPAGLRFQALQYATDWLDGFQLQQADFDNQLDVNVSVVYFGDNARTLSLNTASGSATWATLNTTDNATINESLTEDYYDDLNGGDLGNTNFLDATRQALSHFDSLGDSGDNRLRVILLLTDGKPCAPTESHWSRAYSDCRRGNPEEGEHMRLVNELVDRQFNDDNERVHAVIIDEDNDFWRSFEDDWQSITGGRARQLPDFNQLTFTFNQILSGLASDLLPDDTGTGFRLGIPVATPSGGGNAVLESADELTRQFISPYQQQMLIRLFKARDDTRLELYDPAGNRITGAIAGVQVTGTGGPTEIWTVANPMPGDWRFGAAFGAANEADRFASISLDLIRADVNYAITTDTPTMYRPLAARLSLEGDEGRPLPLYDDPAYRLNGDLTVVAPSGSQQTISLADATRQPGGYEVSFIPREAGEYALTFVASSDANTGNPDDNVRFSNSLEPLRPTVQPVRLHLDGLKPRLLQGISQTVSLRLLEGDRDITDEIPLSAFSLTFVPADSATCDTIPPDAPTFASEDLTDLTLEFSLSDVQRYQACATVALSDSTRPGQTIDLAENTPVAQMADNVRSSTLEVTPVQLLAVEIRRPVSAMSFEPAPEYSITERATLPTLQGNFPFLVWEQPDLRLDIAIVNRETPSETVPLADLLTDETLATLFNSETVQLLNSDTLQPETTIELQSAGGGSRWTADLPEAELRAGAYTLFVQMPSQQLGDSAYAFAPDADRIETTLVIRPNWLAYVTFVGIWGGLLLLIGRGVFVIGDRLTRPARRQRYAPPGDLVIVTLKNDRDIDRIIQGYSLKDHNSNNITMPLNKLPLMDPPLVGLQIQSDRSLINRQMVKVRANINGNILSFSAVGKVPVEIYENALGEKFAILYRVPDEPGHAL